MKTVFITLLLISSTLPLRSQTKPVEVNVAFNVYLWPYAEFVVSGFKEDTMPQLYYKKGDDYKELDLLVGLKSAWKQYIGPRPLVIYKKETHKQTQEIAMRPYAEAKFPLDVKRLIIFIFPKHRDKKNLRLALVVNADDQYIPKGHARFVNMSQQSIQLRLGRKKPPVNIPSMDTHSLSIEGYHGNRLPTMLFVKKGEKWKRSLGMMLDVDPQSKILYLLFPSNSSQGTWRIKSFNMD